MSVLKEPYATPSRVAAVYRFLLQQDRPLVAREMVEAVLSPETLLQNERRSMLSNTINECIRMDLLTADGDRIGLHPDLPAEARDRARGMARLPLTITDLVCRGNGENHDLGRLVAWYLAQDVGSAPGDWDAMQRVLNQQVGTGKLGMTNDLIQGQFKFWACYLGFAWCHAHDEQEVLLPDPTIQVRNRLPEIFRTPGARVTPAQVIARLADICPVFEGGWLRKEIEDQIGPREERMLSPTTAHAWFRLHEEGEVEVAGTGADAEVFIFPDGDRPFRCSALLWRSGAGGLS